MSLLWTVVLACAANQKKTLPTTTLTVAERAVEVEVADEPAERNQGLMYREELPTDGGMLFVYPELAPRSFWMKNTTIPLSIAFMDETGRVLNVEDMAPLDPTSVRSNGEAMYALEMNQGWFDSHGIQRGSVVRGLPGPSER